MKIINQITALLLILAGTSLTACKKDFLNTVPLNQVQSELTWTDPALSEAFVNGIYGGLYEGGFSEEMLASLTDEAIFTHAGRNINTIDQAAITPGNVGWLQNTTSWLNLYNFIRAANIAIENLKNEQIANLSIFCSCDVLWPHQLHNRLYRENILQTDLK